MHYCNQSVLAIVLDLNMMYSVLLIFRSALVGCSLLRASYYYNLTGLGCYVYLFYDPYSYSEYVCFKLSWDTTDQVYFLLLYFYLQ